MNDLRRDNDQKDWVIHVEVTPPGYQGHISGGFRMNREEFLVSIQQRLTEVFYLLAADCIAKAAAEGYSTRAGEVTGLDGTETTRRYIDLEREEPNMETHDYEPGDERHAMHTDPLCRICGQSKKAKVHG